MLTFNFIFEFDIFLCRIDMIGNVIYLTSAIPIKREKEWEQKMSIVFWIYRVISSWLLLIAVSVFLSIKFDARFIQSYEERVEQTINHSIGFFMFIFCWTATPIWQWVAAVLVFDYGNIGSVGRDMKQLIFDGNWKEVIELISFGAAFDEFYLQKRRKVSFTCKLCLHFTVSRACKIETFPTLHHHEGVKVGTCKVRNT